MADFPLHANIAGPIVMIGFGSIGRGTLPLIDRHFGFDSSRLTIIDPAEVDRYEIALYGGKFLNLCITRDNYREVLGPLLTKGGGQGFCVNLSVDTSSLEIMEFCREIGALYIDTVVEPWAGFYFDDRLGPEARSNYALREEILDARRRRPGGVTAISCCGANPGMVSWFVKQALIDLKRDLGLGGEEPKDRRGWGELAARLGISLLQHREVVPSVDLVPFFAVDFRSHLFEHPDQRFEALV